MGQIQIEKDLNGIEGLCRLVPAVHRDARGYVMESYSLRDLAKAGICLNFVQDNRSASVKGVLRGMHFQKQHPQAKLLQVVCGCVFDVAVDLRRNSPSYGAWYGELLSEENGCQLLIPRGFAHGFLTLSDYAVLSYKCDDYYCPGDEGGLAWNDPTLGIVWPNLIAHADGSVVMTDGTPLLLSEKDRMWPCLQRGEFPAL